MKEEKRKEETLKCKLKVNKLMTNEEIFMQKNTSKSQNAITLIALIITIVVLLILAGVTIAQITSNESAPQKAVEAKQKNEEGAELDAINIAVISSVSEGNYNLYVDLVALRNGLSNLVTETNLEEIMTGEGPWTVTGKTGKKYLITSDGDVKSYTATKITTTNNTKEITISNLKDYIGKTVARVTVGSQTVDFGLFYVDFEGKFGDVGTVYLRAKTYTAETALNNPVLNSDAIEIMKQLNPQWASARGEEATKYVEELMSETTPTAEITNAEQGSIYLCNPNASTWSGLKNDFDSIYNTNQEKKYVNYIIGAPSVELFLASYNAKYPNIDTKYSSGFNINGRLNSSWTDPGYLYSNNGGTNYAQTYSGAITSSNSSGGMYLNTTKSEWIASPLSHTNGLAVCNVGYGGSLGIYSWSGSIGVAPLVSLKSGVELTEVTSE